MRAIFHDGYKTDYQLEKAIGWLDKQIQANGPYKEVYQRGREELLYDLANRRDDGELRWINPPSYMLHLLNRVWLDPETFSCLYRHSPFLDKIPMLKKD
jgi:hypothetical protein